MKKILVLLVSLFFILHFIHCEATECDLDLDQSSPCVYNNETTCIEGDQCDEDFYETCSDSTACTPYDICYIGECIGPIITGHSCDETSFQNLNSNNVAAKPEDRIIQHTMKNFLKHTQDVVFSVLIAMSTVLTVTTVWSLLSPKNPIEQSEQLEEIEVFKGFEENKVDDPVPQDHTPFLSKRAARKLRQRAARKNRKLIKLDNLSFLLPRPEDETE